MTRVVVVVVQTAADGRNCTAACLDRNETPFASSGVHLFFFFLPVRALRFTYTDHTPMQFAPGIRLRPVCVSTTTVPFGKPKVWFWMAAFFSFTHIGPVGIFDDGLLNGYYRGP